MKLSEYIIKRILLAIPTIFGVITVLFILLRLIPGDPARIFAGPMASEEDVERIRILLGLDQPIYIQYLKYVENLLTLNLGYSFRSQAPVIQEIIPRLINTVILSTASMAIAIIIGIPLGVIAALKAYRVPDILISSLSLFGVSIPVYWSGLLFILFFSVQLHLLPAGGSGGLKYLILPSLTLSLYLLAFVVKITRASVLDVLKQDYVKLARSKGLKERIVVYRHILRNALIPVITVIGLQFGNLLGGAVLTETVFDWPGMGTLLVDAILARDYPMVQGAIFIFSLLFILINIVVDILYTFIDPRVRFD